MENKKINVIVPFYNVEKYIEQCSKSVMNQKYENFHVYFVDDCSTDNSWNLLPHNDKRATCIKNNIRKTALENIHDVIINYCEPESVVILTDGDDYLIGKDVYSHVNTVFNTPIKNNTKNNSDVWIYYGGCMWSSGNVKFGGIARPIPEKDGLFRMRNFYDSFYISHLRSFVCGLYHKIKEQDENFSCLKDKNGEFYKITYDVGIFLALCEQAGTEHILFNQNKILYWYNRENPINDDKVSQEKQIQVHLEVLKKPPFKKIESLF